MRDETLQLSGSSSRIWSDVSKWYLFSGRKTRDQTLKSRTPNNMIEDIKYLLLDEVTKGKTTGPYAILCRPE